jgi:cytoskeletal protein CcmA (bactofilin family)
MAKRSGEPAVLGKGLRVRGRVRGEGDLRVEASVEGDVIVTGTLELDAGCAVEGAVEAESVLVAGKLDGDVRAKGAVSLSAGAEVRGDVSASGLTIEEGASFVGNVNADFDMPDDLA